jgi:hypothetical protein
MALHGLFTGIASSYLTLLCLHHSADLLTVTQGKQVDLVLQCLQYLQPN